MAKQKKISTIFINLLFPIYCLNCQKKNPSFICPDCMKYLFNKKTMNDPLLDLLIVSCYNRPIKEIIHKFKYGFVKDMSIPLGELMAESIKDFPKENSLLIPVPLFKKRLKWRGFNQAGLLAEQMGECLSIPVRNILQKTRHTVSQAQTDKAEERQKNMEKAFAVSKGNTLKGKTVFLVDDVCTTGSTIHECAMTIKPFGPSKIIGVVLTRGI